MTLNGWTRVAALALVLGGFAGTAYTQNKSTTTERTTTKYDWSKNRAKSWDTEHKTWTQRGGYAGYRVPEDRFSTYFGPEHTFRINSLPYRTVSNEPRFQYNGYWMTPVDPWPESWTDNWYDTDDVYVKYDNGYYLYNMKYPDSPLSLRFSAP